MPSTKPTGGLKSLIAPLASLKLTVVLLGLSIILIFAGTLAQTQSSLWDVLNDYFRSLYVLIPLSLFMPRDIDVSLSVPFPGGYTIGVLMLVNLMVAHSLRFKVKAKGRKLLAGLVLISVGTAVMVWFHNGTLPSRILASNGGYAGVLPLMGIGALFYAPLFIGCVFAFGRRTGIVLIHGALILLLLGEGVTAGAAVETQMPIYEGSTVFWAQDAREVELSVIDASDPAQDFVVAIPHSMLANAFNSGEAIEHADLPFSVTVDRFYSNSELHRVDETAPNKDSLRGIGIDTMAVQRDRASGAGGMSTNMPAAYVTLKTATESLGTYVVSPSLGIDQYVIAEQDVTVDGKAFRIALRFRRYYKSYGMYLEKFNHDVYPGTSIPKNFSSDIRIIDPVNQTDRDVVIHMNNPLRFEGETFFQSGWIPGLGRDDPDRGTVLMVVRNPGWTIPYIACALGTIGLIYQFGFSLVRFLKRSRS